MPEYVIDKNYFETPELEAWLTDKRNIAIIIDYAAMESYSGDAVRNATSSMRIVCRYPEQVRILKGTRFAVMVKPTANFRRLMVDESQTKNFPIYCQALYATPSMSPATEASIIEHGKVATTHLSQMERELQGFIEAIREVRKSVSKESLRKFWHERFVTEEMKSWIRTTALETALYFFANHPRRPKVPQGPEVRNCFAFRMGVASTALYLDHMGRGTQTDVAVTKIRNDAVDMIYVGYATFFDGILSKEPRVNHALATVLWMMRHIFP